MRPGALHARGRYGVSSVLASSLLHGSAILALVAVHRAEKLPESGDETGIEIVWQDRPEDALPGEEEPHASPSAEAAADAPSQDEQAEPRYPEPPPQPAEAASPEDDAPSAPLADVPSDQDAPPAPLAEAPPELPLPPPMAPAPPPRVAARQAPPPSAEAAPVRLAAPGFSATPPPTGGSVALGSVSPPGLLEGVRNPEPDYPLANRQRGDQGVVTVLLRISDAGEVTGVEIVTTSGHPALDESARRAVQRWRFRPAMRNGVPVAGSIRTAVHFRLQ